MSNEYKIRFIKHIIKKIIRKPDPEWPFYNFEYHIHPDTLSRHREILLWAERSLENKERFENIKKYEQSSDPIVQQGYKLKQKVEREFYNKCTDCSNIRLLIQVPEQSISPGGYSFLLNFAESFKFIGIPTYCLGWEENTQNVLDKFKPTLLLVIDHAKFLEKIDWDSIVNYRKDNNLYIGLLAQLEEYGNTPLKQRLDWGKKHKVDFYFSVRDKEYINTRKEYKPFFEQGYSILTIPFGANPLHYYPIPEIKRDINYSFIASTNRTKGLAYSKLAKKVTSSYSGFIDGTGWRHVKDFKFNRDRDRYIYARSKIGLNFHLPEQIKWACEVNERTHQLAMCGVPQLIDTPKILSKLYSDDAVFVCKNGKEFSSHFKKILNDHKYGQVRALKAQREVFEKHTTFHRADAFIVQLQMFLKKP